MLVEEWFIAAILERFWVQGQVGMTRGRLLREVGVALLSRAWNSDPALIWGCTCDPWATFFVSSAVKPFVSNLGFSFSKALNKEYEEYVLTVGDFDERVFLGAEAEEEIGTRKFPADVPGEKTAARAHMECHLQQHFEKVIHLTWQAHLKFSFKFSHPYTLFESLRWLEISSSWEEDGEYMLPCCLAKERSWYFLSCGIFQITIP